MHKNLLIVGGGGFIGKNLVKYLQNEDFKISLLGRINLSDFSNTDVELFNDDLVNLSKYYDLINDSDAILWLAHNLVPGIKLSSLTIDFERNIFPLVQLYENLRDNSRLRKFIFVSSGGAIYGEPNEHLPIREDHLLKPISQYGFSKSIVEAYLTFLSKGKSIDTIILRPSNIFGPLQSLKKPQGIIGFAIDAAINNRTLDLYNEGNQIRDFLYISDFCNAILKIVQAPNLDEGNTSIYNIGSGCESSIKDVIQIIEELKGQKIKKNYLPMREVDCTYNVLDSNRFMERFDWTPKIGLFEGIKSLIN